ncbi:MAG TPA: hypothetical protein VF040_08290 [Ktedonobacterales bacterium]
MTKSSRGDEKKTVELPAVTLEETSETAGMAAASTPDNADDADDARITRELEALVPQAPAETRPHDAKKSGPAAQAIEDDNTQEERETGPSAEMSGRTPSPSHEVEDDLEPTLQRPAVPPPLPLERPRHNTLAAITRPRGSTDPRGTPPPPEPEPEPEYPAFSDDIPDETDYAGKDEEEWAIADQPTVALAPGSVLGARPQYLETDEHSAWPPRPNVHFPPPGTLPEAAASLHRRATPRADRTGQRRLASPTGRPMPRTPPNGVPLSALPDPRMERFRELHRRREAVEHGLRDPRAEKHVTERVRQWWGDLRPGLKQALDYQHEARATGAHPIPAYEPSPTSRLGDVFGRLTASARELTERAQSAAAPAFKRLHNQAEQAAQAIVGRLEGDTTRQQAPFLGPGRIAVFFRSGVSVGQAQRLLSSNEARPLRIIPRKHGFLAFVLPGTEEQVSKRLRIHPYVRDVVYMRPDDYNDFAEDDEYEG